MRLFRPVLFIIIPYTVIVSDRILRVDWPTTFNFCYYVLVEQNFIYSEWWITRLVYRWRTKPILKCSGNCIKLWSSNFRTHIAAKVFALAALIWDLVVIYQHVLVLDCGLAVADVLVGCVQLAIKVIPLKFSSGEISSLQLSEMVWCILSTVCARSFITVNPVDKIHFHKPVWKFQYIIARMKMHSNLYLNSN